MSEIPATARADATFTDDVLSVALGGDWSVTGDRPGWDEVVAGRQPKRVTLQSVGLGQWDSSLLLFLFEAQQWCKITGAHFDPTELPDKIRALLNQMSASHETTVPFDRSQNF